MKDPRRLTRLLEAMAWQAVLSDSEAASAIIAQRQGDIRHGGSEAVVHYGGSEQVIRDSIRNRHLARRFSRRKVSA